MAFIKHGDGKIMAVVETEELTEEQKKAAKNISANKNNQSIFSEHLNSLLFKFSTRWYGCIFRILIEIRFALNHHEKRRWYR